MHVFKMFITTVCVKVVIYLPLKKLSLWYGMLHVIFISIMIHGFSKQVQ